MTQTEKATERTVGSVLVFESAGQRYGMPVENVLQIIDLVAVSRLPTAPEFLVGVIDYRGQVIPIVDIRRRFKQPLQPYSLHTPIVVSQLDGRTVGLVVDEVKTVVDVERDQIEQANQIVTEEMLSQTRFISGVARLSDGLIFMIDPPTLFTKEEATALQPEPQPEAPPEKTSRRRRRRTKTE